ncbi:unnamed protein product [Leptosia nina]|uniref:F-box only protein 9 n=1 Tax=Leptosia nina TaxID=320188 RepID=A0AAV1J5U3_9NEOP
MATASGSGTVASDCEEEDQDDPSSSQHDVQDIADNLSQLNVGKVQSNDYEDELSVFRQQWQRELEATPSPQRESKKVVQELKNTEAQTDEEKAKSLFLRGIEMERSGKLYEAIQHYKRAIQILPDVERRLYDSSDVRADTPAEESDNEEVINPNVAEDSDDDEAIEGEELVTRFQRILAKKGHLFQMQYQAKGCHISWLPYEVIQLILRWVVSAELDAISLERVAAVSRGFHVAARDNDIWKLMCVRTWGIECGTPRANGFANWRQMYIERARLNLHGCYISKTTYLRHGENSFQDQFYRPWYLIDYYRYLRFFPEGLVLMWTTADEPVSCVSQLKYRSAKHHLGIMAGHYRLVGDKVVIVIKKASTEKKAPQSSNTRFRARRKENHEQQEQIFHMELELRNVRSRRNWSLVWQHYASRAQLHRRSARTAHFLSLIRLQHSRAVLYGCNCIILSVFAILFYKMEMAIFL